MRRSLQWNRPAVSERGGSRCQAAKGISDVEGFHIVSVCQFTSSNLGLFSKTSFVFVLQGHEVQLNHRAVLMTEELVLPSLSGLPVKLGVNMTSLSSLRLKGNINYRDTSHFSLTGYIKPEYLHTTTSDVYIHLPTRG